MKWLGQHIVDFIARFRSDVYLEDLTTDSSTDILVVDSDGKICKNAGAGDDTEFTLTADSGSDQTIVDGNTLDIAGGNAITTVVSATDTVTINHDDTSTQASVDNSGNTVIQDIQVDTYGHVTRLVSLEITSVEGATLAETAALANVATAVTASANNTANETVYPTFVDGATGSQGIETDTDLTYNPGTNILTSVNFAGALAGNASGSSGSCTGNAATATALATSRNFQADLASTSTAGFTGAANCTPGVTGTLAISNGGTGATASTGWLNSNVTSVSGSAATVTAGNQASITTCGNLTTVGTIATGTWNAGIIAEGKLQNQSGTNTGDQTNVTGSSGSCTGNAATSTKIASITNTDIVQLAGSQTLTGTKTLNSFKGTGGATVTNILDEDAMGTDSATALATQQSIKAYVDAMPVKAYFTFRGYGTSSQDGSGDAIYEMPEIFSTTNSPFEHDTTTGTDGLTAQQPRIFLKGGAYVMPYNGVIRKFTGWALSAGGGTLDIGLFKATFVDDDLADRTPSLLINTQIDAAGNQKPRSFTEASLSASFNAGDVIYSAAKGSLDAKLWYLGSTLEVEWT